MTSAHPSRTRRWTAVALCAAAYLYVFPYYPKLNNPNENVRFYMTAALVEDGTYAIDGPRARWGWVNDAAVREGHYYSVKAPGTSFLGVPGYALYRWFSGGAYQRDVAMWVVRTTASALPMLAFAYFFYAWLGRHTRRPLLRDVVFVGVTLGSVLLGYTYLFASHATSAAAGFGAFMLLCEARRQGAIGRRRAFLAGLLAAGASLLEYPCFWVSLCLCVLSLWAVRPRRCWPMFALGAALPTLLMMHFQYKAFGNPLSPGHLYVENPAFRAGHEKGFYGASSFHWEGAFRLLWDLRLGLFSLSPMLVLGVLGWVLALRTERRRPEAACALVLSLAMYVFICFMNIWHAGWSIGPRYLVVLVPFLGWGALLALDALALCWPRGAALLALSTALAGVVAAGTLGVYYPHLPDALNYPMAQLMPVLLDHDFAPLNAAGLLGVYGTVSMLPVAVLGLGALLWASVPHLSRWERVWLPAAAGLGALLWLAPHFLGVPAPDKRVRHAVGFITRSWHPPGHDVASRLSERLGMQAAPDPADLRRLSELYREQGRDEAAQRAEAQARP